MRFQWNLVQKVKISDPLTLPLHSLRSSLAMGIIWTVLPCPWTQNKPLLFADVCCAFLGPLPRTSRALLSFLPTDWVDAHHATLFTDAGQGSISFSFSFCLFMLNFLTFNSSTTNSALVITLHIYLYAYISPTNYLNEPSPSGLVIHAFESTGDKGSQGVEERESLQTKRGMSAPEVLQRLPVDCFVLPVLDLPSSRCNACLVLCGYLAGCPAKLLIWALPSLSLKSPEF